MKELTEQRELNELAEAIRSIRADFAFRRGVDLIHEHWLIGQEIVSGEFYQKHAKNNGKIVEAVSAKVGLSARSLYYCIQFFEKYPKREFDEVVPLLGGGKTPKWYEEVMALPGYTKEAKIEISCKHCELHCPKGSE